MILEKMFPPIGVGSALSRTSLFAIPHLLSKLWCLILQTDQGSGNDGSWVISGPPPVFVHLLCELRMFLTFLNSWEKSKECYLVTHENNIKLKFYTATLIHLHIVHGYFCITTVELIDCDRAFTTCKPTS